MIAVGLWLLFVSTCFNRSAGLINKSLRTAYRVSLSINPVTQSYRYQSTMRRATEVTVAESSNVTSNADSLPPRYLQDKNELLFELFQKARNLTAVAEQYVNFCDEDFNMFLNDIIKAAPSEIEKVQLGKIRYEVNKARQLKLREADTLLRGILSAGSVLQMEAKLDMHLGRGEVDMAFMVILQVNLEDALRANAQTAVEVMEHLRNRINQHQDSMVSPPVRLMRLLVRLEDRETRKQLLRQKLLIGQNLLAQQQAAAVGARVEAQRTVTAQCDHIIIDPVKEWGAPDVLVQELFDTIADVETQMSRVGSEPDDITFFQRKCFSIRKEIEEVVSEVSVD